MGRHNRGPEIREQGKADNPKGEECEACAKTATRWVRVAWDYMRGNDDIYLVCDRHASIANQNLRRFLAHCRSKDKFLNRESQSTE